MTFQTPQQEKAAKCSLHYLGVWGKFANNIGILASALIGRTERGFDFLGYYFGPEGLAIAEKTLNNFVERAIRLYEQGPGEPFGSTRGVRKPVDKIGRGGSREYRP